MSHTANRNAALRAYNQVAVQTGVGSASPHRLIQMLMEAALEKIAAARGCMERGQVADKGAHIGHAVSIIEGLRVSLDMERGGEIAANLNALYDYMERRLTEANAANDPALLKEVAGLLQEIKSAWDAIPEALHGGPVPDARQAGG